LLVQGGQQFNSLPARKATPATKLHHFAKRSDTSTRQTPNTLNGHRLLWWTRETASQDSLAEALFRAYFSEGRDLGKLEVLADVAAEVGLSREQARLFLESDQGREEVLAEEREARRRGLNSVPFFFLNAIPAFAGAQPPGVFVEAFRKVLASKLAPAPWPR
jgi:predicted DsbA family dithiol-disulfide isomerase